MGKLIEAIQSLFKPKNESSSSQPNSANSGSSGGSSSGKSIAGFSFTPLGTSESGERPSPWAEVKKTTTTPKSTGNIAPFFGGTSTAKGVSSFVPNALPKDSGGAVQVGQKKSFLDYLKPVAQTGNAQPSVQPAGNQTKKPLISTPNYSWGQYKSDLNAIKQKTDNGIFQAKKEITQSEAQKRATKTYNDRTRYYGSLMNNIDLGTDKGKADYKDLITRLDTEIESKARPKLGEDDGFAEFDAKALRWVKDDLVNRAREFGLEQNRVSAQQYNDNIDRMIVATGVTSAPDYEVMSAKGMEAIEQKLASQRKRAEAMDEMYNRLVDPEGKTSGRVDLFASDWDDYDALSNEQKRLFGYIYATQGEDAAEDVFINFLGDVARYNQGVESTENMLSSDNAINRGFRKVLSGLPSAIATALSGWEQTIKNSSVEDNDKSQLFAGVSVDDMKRNIVANLGVDLYDEGVQRAAVNAWQNGGSTGEWYQELMTNGSDEEKVLYNYLLAAYGEETAAQTYSVVQDDADYITRTIQGSGALPIGSEQVRSQLLDDYYGMSGAGSIFFDDMTRGQALNLMIDTASQQLFQKGIQLGISAIPGVGAFAKPISLALLGAQVYGNTYNAAKREGYSDRESAIYASAMGATEVAAELLLDGFTGYDGVLMKKINASTWVENIANPLMKGLVKAGFNAAGEGFEEVFSDVVEPIARGLILKDESASFDFSQAKDDFVAAAVTTLLMGAGGDISQEYGYSGYGESLSKMNATRKIIDTIQLVPVGQSKNQVKSYQEAQKIADGVMSGSLKATDNNVGRMTSAYIHAGGDLEFLANPMTACYTVDNISVDDMAAAATSRLVDLGGNTENPVTAMAIAKTAKGASLTTEEKAAFDAEKSASQIVEELSGDANSLEDNALTRAARASISGQTVQQKTYETLKQSNPQAHVADPATQYLLEQGVDQRQALAQGAIIAAVKDGVQVDAKTAGKIKLNSIPTQYVLMDQLGIEADATTTQAELMQMLNDKAAEFAALKVEQQELKAATKAQIKNETKQATKEAKRARLTAQMAAENGGANGEQVRQLEENDVQGAVGVQGQSAQNMGENTPGNDGGRLGPYAADVGPGGRPVGESQPGGSGRRGEKFGRMDGGVRPSVVRGPGGLILNYEDPDASHTVDVADLLAGKAAIIGADGKLMPPDEQKKLGERCVATKRRLNKNGFYSVRFFFNTVDDYKAYGGRITKTDTGYNADICLNGRKFTLEQYARHETMHLWLRAFQFTKRAGGKKDDQIINRFYQFAKEVWGEKFEGAYKKQLEKYREQYPSRQDRANQREALGELLCIAYGAQEIPGRDGSDPGVQERLQKWMKDNHVEAMGSGDMSDPYVREAVKKGNYEPEFYRRQGFLTEENSADNLFGLARFTEPAKEEETQEKPKKPRGRSNKTKNVETPIGIAFQSKEASERSQMVKNARDKLKGMSVDEREFLEDRYAQYKDVIDSLRVGDKFIQTEDDKSIMIGEVIAQDSRYVLISNSAGTEDSDLTLILKDHKKQNGAFISLTGETYFDDDVVIQYSSDEAYDNYEDYEELMSDSLEREGVRENDAAYEYGMFKEDSEATDKGMIGEEEETSAKLDKSLEEVDFSKMTPDEVTEYWNNFAVAQESMMDKTLEEDLAKEDEKQAKAEAKKRAKAEEKQKTKKAETPVAQAFKPKAESVNAEETVAEKPKRGRPKGSKNKPKVTETAPAVETKAAETAPAFETKATETAPAVETKATETANPASVFQEAPGQKTAPAMNDYWIRRTVTALTKDGKDGSVYSMNGETFIESGDGYMAVPVRVADVDRFKAATTLGEVTEPPVVTQGDNFTKLANAPRVAVTADGRYYEFATEAGPVYFESKRFNYFDGAALEIGTMADGGHVLKATNQDGTIRGYLSSFDVDPASVTEYKNAYGMKSFAEQKPKTETKEPKTEAKKPKSEAQKPKKTEQKPKTEAKKPAPEKTERDKAVAVAFAPKAEATKAKTTEAKTTEAKAPTNATGLTFNNKVGNWVNNLANADNIRVARPNANRNTYQVVAFTKGKTYAYDDVSPSMLKKAFGKDKAAEIVSAATEMAGELASFDIEHAPVADQKAAAAERAKKRAEEKAARERDTYGRLVSKGMMSFMQNSKARTDDSTDGALVPVYRVAEPGAVHNAKLIGGVSIWTDKPAVANTWRGMKGAEAYGQTGKRIGPKGHRTTIDAAMTQLAELDPESKEAAQYRALIAASERKLREYTNGVTRLDPWREAFSTPHDEDIVNGAALYECYLNLTNPLVVDAKGKGLAYVQEIAGKIQGSEYDGAIIHNANGIVTDTNLGGGELDLSTVYITTKAGQGKSTLNTNPTDDALMQYSDDEFITAEIEAEEKADRADEMRDRLLDADDLYRLRGVYYRFMSSDEENFDVDLEDLYEALYFDKRLREDVSYLLYGNKEYSYDMLYGEFKREIINPFIDFLRHEYYRGQQETAKRTYKTGSLADRPGFRSKLLEAVEKLQADKNGRIKVNDGTINRIIKAGGGVSTAEMNLAMVKQFLEGRGYFTVDEFRQWYNEHNANLDILELTGDEARWKEYQMKSLGESYDYTERLYVLPQFMGYRNDAMNTHWGKVLMHDADAICDVAVHARYNTRPDPQTGELRLFIEEIQSDWDNARGKNHSGPSAPLDSSKYPEFVLKQLIKEAVDNAEGVAWTDAHTQATRWSYQFFTAYRNLYDRALVKAASKYGKVYHEDVSGQKGLTDDTWQYYDYLAGEFPENYDGNQIYQAAYDMSMAVRLANGSSPEDKIGVAVDSFVTRAQSLSAGHNYNLSKHLADNPEVLRNLYALIQEVDGKEGYWVLELDEKGYNQFKNGEVYAYSDDEFVEYDFSDDESAENNYADGTLESNILNVLRKAGNSEEASAALAEYVSNLLNTGEIPLVDAKTAAQERAANVFQPKVSSEEHAVIRDQLDDLIEKYGAIPKGYKPTRDVAIPKSTDGETFVRNFVRTAVEAKGVTDASVDLLERGVLQDQMLSHSVQTDKAAIANADRTIRKLGFQRALNEWRGRADGERAMTKNDVVLGECLMIAANKAGDLETGYQLAAELAEAGTNAGQVTQAFSILKKAPPAWQLYYINRVVNRMNTKYAKRINSGKMTQVVINRDLAKAVLRAKTQEDITTAMDALLDDIASQIPATYMDKWNAWRYLAMLGNPRTHIRNIVGNAIFTPAKFAKDMIAAGLESGFENAGFEFTRSKTTRPVSAERKAFAEADFEGIRDELQSGGKYNPENVIEQHRTIFGIPLLEMARKKNGDYLEAEDGIFLKRHYVNALGKYLEANNADLNWLRTTKDGARLLNAARQYAVLEARKATYRDASRVASALNSLKNVPGLGVLMEGAMPFTKTPVNILKRGIEYSPVGLIKTIATETGKLKTGEINVNAYCDNLAAGMTGTGIMFLGAFLTSLGLLRGGPDDDDKKAEFDKLQGYQDYSITIGDQNFTIDWACPVAMPLFVGAELYKAFDKGDGLSNGDWMNLATVIAEPMTQLSMLSGLNDALSSAKYDKNPLSSVAVTLGTGYISQVFPTLLAQISRSMVEDRRTTYVDKNSDVPAALQRWFQSNVMGKTPANASRAKYIDAWGRYDTDASLLVRLFDNMIAPWYRNTITTEPLEAELTRLSESVGTGVLMTAPERYVDWNNNRIDLTAEQYSDLALTRGQTLHIALDSLINSEAYSAMTDEQRAKAVENIKNYATYAGRKEVIPEYQSNVYNWIDKCDGDPNRIENMAIMRSVANSLGVDADNNSKFYDLVIGADWMTPQEQGQILSQTYVTTSKTFKYGGKTYDLTPEVKAALYQEYRNVFPLYYAELAATEKWQTATGDKKLGLLADLRSDVAAKCRKVIGAQLSNGTLDTLGSTGVLSSTGTLGNSSNLTGAGTLGQFPW